MTAARDHYESRYGTAEQEAPAHVRPAARAVMRQRTMRSAAA
jgi:hypothetical protein